MPPLMPSFSLVSSLSRPCLVLVLTLLGLFAFLTAPAHAQSSPQAVSLAVDGSGFTWMLRDNPDGTAALWKINSNGSLANQTTYGPYAGWTAKAIAVGANNIPRIIWNNTDGRVALWNLADAQPQNTCLVYGPFTAYTAGALAVGSNNLPGILWDRTDGTLSLWSNIDVSGNYTHQEYGPYAGWTARALAVGPNNTPRVLWTNTDGSLSLWNAADATPTATCLIYGPYAGSTAKALAVGANNLPCALWTTTNGSFSVWTLVPTTAGAASFTAPAPLGFTASALAVGADNLPRVLWAKADGSAQLWVISGGTAQIWNYSATGTLTTSVYPPPASSLTQAQAIARAQAFCAAVGAAVTATPTAVYPAPNRYPSQQDTYWQPRWRIQFGSQAEVDVVNATGVIAHYYNFALSQQLLSANSPAGTPLTEANALLIAASTLQASGQPASELASSPTDQNFQLTDPPTQAGNLWMVRWGRQWGSLPYRQQQATLMLQAETGAVQAFGLTFPSPSPSVGAGPLASSQAVSAAQTLLTGKGLSGLTLQSVTTQIVQPNTYWQNGGSAVPAPNVAGQVAWNAVFTDANNTVYEVWVDTYAGTVLGGESYGIAGRRRSKPLLPSPAKGAIHHRGSVKPLIEVHTPMRQSRKVN